LHPGHNHLTYKLLVILLASFLSAPLCPLVLARVSGPCANCHTMHNSQNGGAMNFDDTSAPNHFLSCLDSAETIREPGEYDVVLRFSSEIQATIHVAAEIEE